MKVFKEFIEVENEDGYPYNKQLVLTNGGYLSVFRGYRFQVSGDEHGFYNMGSNRETVLNSYSEIPCKRIDLWLPIIIKDCLSDYCKVTADVDFQNWDDHDNQLVTEYIEFLCESYFSVRKSISTTSYTFNEEMPCGEGKALFEFTQCRTSFKYFDKEGNLLGSSACGDDSTGDISAEGHFPPYLLQPLLTAAGIEKLPEKDRNLVIRQCRQLIERYHLINRYKDLDSFVCGYSRMYDSINPVIAIPSEGAIIYNGSAYSYPKDCIIEQPKDIMHAFSATEFATNEKVRAFIGLTNGILTTSISPTLNDNIYYTDGGNRKGILRHTL